MMRSLEAAGSLSRRRLRTWRGRRVYNVIMFLTATRYRTLRGLLLRYGGGFESVAARSGLRCAWCGLTVPRYGTHVYCSDECGDAESIADMPSIYALGLRSMDMARCSVCDAEMRAGSMSVTRKVGLDLLRAFGGRWPVIGRDVSNVEALCGPCARRRSALDQRKMWVLNRLRQYLSGVEGRDWFRRELVPLFLARWDEEDLGGKTEREIERVVDAYAPGFLLHEAWASVQMSTSAMRAASAERVSGSGRAAHRVY